MYTSLNPRPGHAVIAANADGTINWEGKQPRKLLQEAREMERQRSPRARQATAAQGQGKEVT